MHVIVVAISKDVDADRRRHDGEGGIDQEVGTFGHWYYQPKSSPFRLFHLTAARSMLGAGGPIAPQSAH